MPEKKLTKVKLSPKSRGAIAALVKAARTDGWEADQGSETDAKKSAAALERSTAKVHERVAYLEDVAIRDHQLLIDCLTELQRWRAHAMDADPSSVPGIDKLVAEIQAVREGKPQGGGKK